MILALMLVSQVLLSGFVFFWLSSQYNNQKQILSEELKDMYVESRNEILDTLIIERLIMPFSGDSLKASTLYKQKETSPYNRDSLHMSVFFDSKPDSTRNKKATYSITVMDSAVILPGQSGEIDHFPLKLNELLLRSTKLFMFESSDTLSEGSTLRVVLRDLIDSTLFKEKFEARLDKQALGVTLDWQDSLFDTIQKHPSNILLIYDGNADNLPMAVIKNYRLYLLKTISPQIVFVFVLLLITAIAFYLSYKSLRKQILLNHLRSDFVSNLTHELKTPVATVKVALESLRKYNSKNDPEQTAEYLRMSSLEMDRLDGLISKVLNHALLEDDTGYVNAERIDLTALIQEVIHRLEPRLIAEKALIKFEEKAEVFIRADRLLCEGILINLIDNSMKYCDKDAEINIHLKTSDKEVAIEIADNGPGIPTEYLDKVFDKFFRIPTNDIHNIKGHGLGLSYVNLVMKSHGGRVKVKNLQAQGCLFTLTFPGIKNNEA